MPTTDNMAHILLYRERLLWPGLGNECTLELQNCLVLFPLSPAGIPRNQIPNLPRATTLSYTITISSVPDYLWSDPEQERVILIIAL